VPEPDNGRRVGPDASVPQLASLVNGGTLQPGAPARAGPPSRSVARSAPVRRRRRLLDLNTALFGNAAMSARSGRVVASCEVVEQAICGSGARIAA